MYEENCRILGVNLGCEGVNSLEPMGVSIVREVAQYNEDSGGRDMYF